jgi:hypothetical protein
MTERKKLLRWEEFAVVRAFYTNRFSLLALAQAYRVPECEISRVLCRVDHPAQCKPTATEAA